MKYEESMVLKIVNEIKDKLPDGWTYTIHTKEQFEAHQYGNPGIVSNLKTTYTDSTGKVHEFYITLAEDGYKKPEHIYVTINGAYKRRSNITRHERVLEIAKEGYENFVNGTEAGIRFHNEKEQRRISLETDFPTAVKSTYMEMWSLIDKNEKGHSSGIQFRKYNGDYTIEKVYGHLSKEQIEQIFTILKSAGKVSI